MYCLYLNLNFILKLFKAHKPMIVFYLDYYWIIILNRYFCLHIHVLTKYFSYFFSRKNKLDNVKKKKKLLVLFILYFFLILTFLMLLLVILMWKYQYVSIIQKYFFNMKRIISNQSLVITYIGNYFSPVKMSFPEKKKYFFIKFALQTETIFSKKKNIAFGPWDILLVVLIAKCFFNFILRVVYQLCL